MKLQRTARSIWNRALGRRHGSQTLPYIRSMFHTGESLVLLGEWNRALTYFQRTAELAERSLGPRR